MIELIHKYPIMIKTLLTLITITFIATGGWMLGTGDNKEFAAKVGDEVISIKEYQSALDRTRQLYRNIYQGNLPEDLMKMLDLEKMTLDSLVENRLILLAAREQGMSVTDAELADEVRGNASFQDETGRFSKDAYLAVLKANGLTVSGYEQSVRDELLVQKFRRMIKDSVYVTEGDVRAFYMDQLKIQGREFSEKEFEEQKQSLARMATMTIQDRTLKSFVEGLKSSLKIEVNPSVLASS